jgi:hypothetical protein
MRIVAITVGFIMAVGTSDVLAQGASENIKRQCRGVADNTARQIIGARSSKVDPATAVRRVANSWLEGVQAHMLLSASRADHMSESELASLGYSYCVERRPTDAR